jgi:hypothetical protein
MNREYEYDFDKDEVKKKLPLPYGINKWNSNYGYGAWDYDEYETSGQTVTTPGSLENKNQAWKQQKFWNNQDKSIHNPNENGTDICEKDLMGATEEEILEICEDNPQGVAQYLHNLIYNEDAFLCLQDTKGEY